MSELLLTQGQVSIIADDDYGWLSEVNWHAAWDSKNKSFRAIRALGPRLKQRKIRMHNAIWEHHNGPIPDGYTVDHVNRDTLDNRLSNLRLATPSQQNQNRIQRGGGDTSTYRGVGWNKATGKWTAKISVDGKHIFLGHYADEVEAALVRDAAARVHHGEFAQLNFPEVAP